MQQGIIVNGTVGLTQSNGWSLVSEGLSCHGKVRHGMSLINMITCQAFAKSLAAFPTILRRPSPIVPRQIESLMASNVYAAKPIIESSLQ